MVRSTGTPPDCLPRAKARVRIDKLEGAERMRVRVRGLRPETEYDLFVIQTPDLPFGLSWYQGDIQTDCYGKGESTFIGRFNEETFTVAPNTAPAPVVHKARSRTPPPIRRPRPCTSTTSGCGSTRLPTPPPLGATPHRPPFNGEHNAGVQILSTRNFPRSTIRWAGSGERVRAATTWAAARPGTSPGLARPETES